MPTRETEYGRYTIKTMSSGGEWRSRAFRRMEAVGDIQVAATPEASILAVKGMLDDIAAAARSRRGADGYPTAEEVRAALASISISRGQEEMLRAHLRAPDHVLTATQLAGAAGYKEFGAANLQYGLLGRSLAEELDWRPNENNDGVPTWTFTLATDADAITTGDRDEFLSDVLQPT